MEEACARVHSSDRDWQFFVIIQSRWHISTTLGVTEPEPFFRRWCSCMRVNLVRCDHLQIASGSSRRYCAPCRCFLAQTSIISIEIRTRTEAGRRNIIITVKDDMSEMQSSKSAKNGENCSHSYMSVNIRQLIIKFCRRAEVSMLLKFTKNNIPEVNYRLINSHWSLFASEVMWHSLTHIPKW